MAIGILTDDRSPRRIAHASGVNTSRTDTRRRLTAAVVALLLVVALAACDRTSTSLPPAPTPLPPTSPPVPVTGPYVLSGLIFELTPTGAVPIADAEVEVAVCPGQVHDNYTQSRTDDAGTYRAAGLCAGTTYLWVGKPGDRVNRKDAPQCDGDCVYVYLTRDTRFDVELVRE